MALADLTGVLTATLSVDDAIDFGSLRLREQPPAFAPPVSLVRAANEPLKEVYTARVEAPSGFKKLLPGAQGRYQRALLEAEKAYAAEHNSWQTREKERLVQLAGLRAVYDAELKAFEEKKALRDAEVDAFEAAYSEGDPDAIVAYFSMVLERSSYPEGFPQNFSVAYVTASKQLVVEYELPGPDIVPPETDFRYSKTRDESFGKSRKPAEIKAIYADVIAAVALRTLHEVFEADRSNHIEACCFNGYVSTVDPATGKDVQPHVISVRTTRERFVGIDLGRVDKSICLKNLGAQVSRAPAEAQPVKPIIEFDMADARFVDQHNLVSGLSSAQNLMDLNPSEFEHLVANLFKQMGLDSKLTRSSRDGGVDCIAYDPRPVLGGKVVIQAKRYRHTVGVSAVRDLYGTMMNEGANKGILVTTSGYGPDAFDFSKEKPVELIDGGGLLFLLQEIGINARIVMPVE